jgi:putative oxidoreductase
LHVRDRFEPIALLGLRVLLGAVMIGHGYGKVFQGGLERHVHMVSSLGLPGWLAYPSAFTEFFGGILLVLGVVTRAVSLLVLIDMAVAIWKVHWKNGMFGHGGYEFPLSLAVIAFALLTFGGGPIALDRIFERQGGVKNKKNSKSK